MPPFALLHDAATGGWLRFAVPREVIAVSDPAAVGPALARVVRRAAAAGLWAVGWVAYEAAPAFDPALAVRPAAAGAPPLLAFALCPPPERVAADPRRAAPPLPAGSYELGPWHPSVDDAGYRAALARIRRHIARGDTYQVNYTYRLRAPFAGDPRGLFIDLVAAQGGDCGGWIDAGRHAVCCASPELFFRLEDLQGGGGARTVTMRPMKGTARRGRWSGEDREHARELAASEKERAENLMIVDMVRNDLGRIAEPGSVAVDALFTAERYPTVWQLTSTVSARTREPAERVFAALFPCASITGAPKPRTSRIIADLEAGPRGLYTGAVGWFTPGGGASFRVAIRTAVVDRAGGTVEYGVGGGIVWDSRPEREAAEARAKARVLAGGAPAAGFELLETLLWRPGEGFTLLREHLQRAAASAEYFGFRWHGERVRAALEAAVLGGAAPLRVRLLVARDGACRVETAPLREAELGAPNRAEAVALAPLPLAVAAGPVDAGEVFLFHKTTRRGVYDAAFETARHRRPGCADVVLWNTRGEVTETTTANLVVERDGVLVTPPVACGLLAGTLRRRLLASGEVEEAIVRLEELGDAGRLWLVNSVRGWRPGVLAAGEGRRPG